MAGIYYSSEYLDVEEINIFAKTFSGVLTFAIPDSDWGSVSENV